jgi:uncharacterized RDD family membrane protein YckC
MQWAAPPSIRPVAQPPRPVSKDRWPSLHALEQELGLGEEVREAPVPLSPSPAKEIQRVSPAPRTAAVQQEARPAQRIVTVAPLWRRVLAWLVDASLLLAILFGLLWLGKAIVAHGPPSRLDGLDYVAETLWSYEKLWIPAAALCVLLSSGYLALFTALGGQTPGKRLLGLSVIDRAGENPGVVRSGARAALAIVSGALMLMGFFLVLVDRRRQALHDKLAGTFVVMTAERG